MGYIDLIPDVFRLTMPDLATGKSYHTQKFNVGNKQCIGVTIKASQALSVAVAYGIATDTAAAAGVDIAASLPYKTSATSFASNTSTEGGTYHEIAVPPHARQAQLVISNASGSTVSGAVIDAALRVVAYPAASGSGSSDFASITGWPGSSSQFVHADGSYSPLSATDMIWAVATTTRSTNAFSGDLAVAPASLATGLIITWRVPSAPSGASTYNLNSLGAKSIYRGNAAAVAADLPANRDIIMRYDGTQWQIIGFGTLTALDILPALAGVVINLGTSSGSANALAGASTVDTATTFTSGRLYHIRTNAANSGAATCAINGGTGVAIRKSPTSTALSSGDIADATELLLYYDGTYLQVLAGLTITATDSSKIALSTIDAKGDLLVGTANDTVARQAVGTDGQVLTADSAQTNGLKWATPSGVNQRAIFSRITSNQTANASYAITTLDLNSEVQDTGNNWSVSGGVLTCATTGTYELKAQVITGNGSAFVGFAVNRAGATSAYLWMENASGYVVGDGVTQAVCSLDLTAGDTVEVIVRCSGLAIKYANAAYVAVHSTWLDIRRVA